MIALDIKVKLEGDLEKEESRIARKIAYQIPIEERRISRETQRTGHIARRKVSRRTSARLFRRSAPGEPPADDTGRFRREVTIQRSGRQSYRVIFGTPYAGILEVKLNRPFTKRAIEAAIKKVINDGRIQLN